MPRDSTERRAHFEQLIRQAEALSASNPAAYRTRIALLALLGYGVLFGTLILLIILLAGSVWAALASTALLLLLLKKKLIFFIAYFIYVLARALWVKIDPPQGYELRLNDYPELKQVIDELSSQLATPRIHRVLLNEDFNAAISQTPRLGVFGWPSNTLILGLQLLLALSPEQAKAVLAHEFGHLSNNHGRFAAWIYRVRSTWYQVMVAFDQAENWGARLLARFFDWYSPMFNAYSFALARANEFEADALSAQLTSREAAGSALVTTYAGNDYLGKRYWEPFIRRADVEPLPDSTPFRGLAEFVGQQRVDDILTSGVEQAMRVETGHADTHPALRDRLQALRVEAPVSALPATSAARVWLGKRYVQVLDDMDSDWFRRNGEAWVARCREADEARGNLAALREKPDAELTQEELWQRAAWTERYVPDADALPLFQAYAQAYPDDPDGDLVIGRHLLDRDDPAGLAHLERAAGHFHHARLASEIAHVYHRRRGDAEAAEIWLRRYERQIDLEETAQRERAQVGAKDDLLAAELSDEALKQLANQLTHQGFVKKAWICRKALRVLPEDPVYVLTFQPRGLFPKEGKLVEQLTKTLQGPGLTFIIMKGGKANKLAKRVIKLGVQVL